MPKLQTYSAPATGIPVVGGRQASADDFGAGVGEALGAVGKTLGKVYDDAGEAEARKALILSTELRAKYAKQLDDAVTSGADTGAIQENMNNELAAIGSNFATSKGQSALRMYQANTNLMFDQQANAIRVQRAGIEAHVEGQKFLNSTAALINTNPAYLSVAEQDAEAFASTLIRISPEKRKEIAQTLKQELNATAAIASARLDPQDAQERLRAGDWNLTPEARKVAEATAEQVIRERRADENYKRANLEYQERERDEAARDKQFAAIVKGEATTDSIMNDPDLRPATREHLINVKEQRANELANNGKASNPVVKRDLWLAVNAPSDDPTKTFNTDPIYAAVRRGDLNTTDANQLIGQIAAQKDENGRSFAVRLQGRISTVAAAMRASPQYQVQPELAAAIQNEMIVQVEQKSMELRRANKDPEGLLDPNSKDYYFTPNRIKLVADDVQRQAQALRPNIVDLRTTPDAEIPVGMPFLNSKGVQSIMTPEAFAAREKAKGASAPASSTKTTAGLFGPTIDTTTPVGPNTPTVASELTGLPRGAAPVKVTKAALYDEYKAASDAYKSSIDELSRVLGNKSASTEEIRNARQQRDELKKRSDAAHDAWQRAK